MRYRLNLYQTGNDQLEIYSGSLGASRKASTLYDDWKAIMDAIIFFEIKDKKSLNPTANED
ncbi:hypothetical protein DU508_16970 [Pedobacter chinensis]|uniref:Uncharacterized protein n=1 Tax=Pedobacter chinensis TaxID=2282421 RepID=A0A369PW97_9SPHI|nr:hypothetical protein DU508_16970 [Pedobacter chinensis]